MLLCKYEIEEGNGEALGNKTVYATEDYKKYMKREDVDLTHIHKWRWYKRYRNF